MLKLLKVEWMKIKNYKVFLVFSILYGLSLMFMMYIIYNIYNSIMSNGPLDTLKETVSFFKFPNLWSNGAFFMGFLVYMPGIIIITFCVNEFTFKTHRQNIIDGWKRSNFLTGKLLLIGVFSLAITLIYILSIFIFSKVLKINFTFKGSEAIGYFFVQTFFYLLVAFTLAILFRKSGIAIILFILFGLIIDNILLGVLNNYVSPAGNFGIVQAADTLTPLYFVDISKLGSGETLSIYKNGPGRLVMLGVTLVYASIFCFLGYKKFIKDDL